MKKFLALLAVFAVTINVTYLVSQHIDEYVISSTAPEPPKVRVPNVKPEVIEEAKKITVLISNENWGNISRGTGVLISKTHVLTCAHLIETWEDDFFIFLADGSMVKGRAVFADKKNDLAVLELSHPVRVKSVARFAPVTKVGEPMAIIGNAGGFLKWLVSGGIVSGKYKTWIMSDAFQIGGNSGGPWINAKGEIIAIAAWTIQRPRGTSLGINGGIDVPTITKFLAEFHAPKKLV